MLKLQCFGHLMRRADSLEKTLMLGKTEGRRRRHDRGWDGWMASLTQWTWIWANPRGWQRTVKPGVLQSMGSKSRDRPEWRKKNNYTHIYATGSLCCTPQTLQINHASVKICVPTDKISGFSIASMTWVKYQFKDYWLYISKQQLYVENMNFDII